MPRKKRPVPLQVSADVKDTPRVITLAQLRKKLPGLKKFPRIDPKQIGAAATTLFKRHGPLPSTPVLELSARHPYDPAGRMIFEQIPWWDPTDMPLIWMAPYVDSMRKGTMGYVQFNAPKKGPYLVVANFTGLASTMTLDGPWGINTGYANTSADAAAAMALWSANAVGAKLGFRVSCASENMSWLRSIQFFEYV